ncbi:hypothetical protein [Neptunomonas sp.]|uniref:hypothetical protein n=1 Tax=Neptunomonas sp. TaxID=1971898 RepID=UPI003564C9D7
MKHIRWSFLCFFVFFVSNIHAENSEFSPENSQKSIEIKIRDLLEEKLKISSKLSVMDNDGNDLRVTALFAADRTKGLPAIVVFVDTKIVNADTNGDPLSQTINIVSSAEINLISSERLKLLEWANAWNSNLLPIQAHIVKGQLLASVNLITAKASPISEEIIIASYLSLVQIWPSIIKSLNQNKLVR